MTRIEHFMRSLAEAARGDTRVYFTGGATSVNVELASPADFIPVRAGWEDRSPFVAREGRASYRHFDLCAQALAKIERGHTQDLQDVSTLLDRGLVNRAELDAYFTAIEPELYRYPALDPRSFGARVQEIVRRR